MPASPPKMGNEDVCTIIVFAFSYPIPPNLIHVHKNSTPGVDINSTQKLLSLVMLFEGRDIPSLQGMKLLGTYPIQSNLNLPNQN